MINEKTLNEAYKPLADLMEQEHGKILLISELDEIIEAVDKVNENLAEVYRVKCDVEGCDLTSCNQGMMYQETGYWCLCQVHAAEARAGKPQPQMKQEAIEREKSRKPF